MLPHILPQSLSSVQHWYPLPDSSVSVPSRTKQDWSLDRDMDEQYREYRLVSAGCRPRPLLALEMHSNWIWKKVEAPHVITSSRQTWHQNQQALYMSVKQLVTVQLERQMRNSMLVCAVVAFLPCALRYTRVMKKSQISKSEKAMSNTVAGQAFRIRR